MKKDDARVRVPGQGIYTCLRKASACVPEQGIYIYIYVRAWTRRKANACVPEQGIYIYI